MAANLLSSEQVADLLGISRRQAQRLMRLGHLPAEKLGRDWFARPEDVEQFERRPVGWPAGRKKKASE